MQQEVSERRQREEEERKSTVEEATKLKFQQVKFYGLGPSAKSRAAEYTFSIRAYLCVRLGVMKLF